MKCWACACSQSLGRCGGGPNTSGCEEFPGGGCQDFDVGDFGIMQMKPAQIEASTTKFWGKRNSDGNLVLVSVGFLAAAGLRENDVLLGINDLVYADQKQRQEILTCGFLEPHLTIKHRYANGKQEKSVTIDNPALPQTLDEEAE